MSVSTYLALRLGVHKGGKHGAFALALSALCFADVALQRVAGFGGVALHRAVGVVAGFGGVALHRAVGVVAHASPAKQYNCFSMLWFALVAAPGDVCHASPAGFVRNCMRCLLQL